MEKIRIIGYSVERGFNSPPTVAESDPERRYDNSYREQHQLDVGGQIPTVRDEEHTNSSCALPSAIGQREIPKAIHEPRVLSLHAHIVTAIRTRADDATSDHRCGFVFGSEARRPTVV